MKLRPHIRKASPQDLPSIQKLVEGEHLSFDGIPSLIDNFLVAEIEGMLAGAIGLEVYGSEGLLRSAAVSSTYQGRGIGSMLTEAITAEASHRGVRTLILLTDTAESFFASRGFTIIDRKSVHGDILSSTQFRGACPSTATVMEKKI